MTKEELITLPDNARVIIDGEKGEFEFVSFQKKTAPDGSNAYFFSPERGLPHSMMITEKELWSVRRTARDAFLIDLQKVLKEHNATIVAQMYESDDEDGHVFPAIEFCVENGDNEYISYDEQHKDRTEINADNLFNYCMKP
jgi:hypothetical protein